MLLADWFGRLASDAGLSLPQYGTSGNTYTLGSPDSFNVCAEFIDDEPYLRFVSGDRGHSELVAKLAAKAAARVQAADFGGEVWYSTELHESTFSLASPHFMGSLFQQLGNQTRIAGWRRLGRSVLLEFTEEQNDEEEGKAALLAPKAIVKVCISVPGPMPGHFSSNIAHGALEITASICTFALGRPMNLPHVVFPADEENYDDLNKRRTDEQILTLARKGVPLDIFGWLSHTGGVQIFARLRSSLLTFDAAVRQYHDAVACILYVVAAESLTTTAEPWRSDKLTKRFREFFDELMPDALDEIVAHGNFEEAIGVKRGTRTPRALRREALDRIYSFRAGQLHEGLGPSYGGFTVDPGTQVRRGLFSEFAEAAILSYIGAPRTSLIRHPSLSIPPTA